MCESPSQPAEPCRICGGELRNHFPGTLLGHVDVQYALCQSCGSLILPGPTWLGEAYSKVIVPDPDQGALRRSLFIHRTIRRMQRFRICRRHGTRVLDFGAGRGYLLRLLLDSGQDAWGFDIYPHPVLAEDRVLPAPPPGPFHLVTAIEVLEHTLDPVPTLERLKELSSGLVLVSTEFFDASVHDPSWTYLCPEHGQHITLFSHEGFRRAVDRAGLLWLGSLPLDGRDFLHVLSLRDTPPSAFRWWRFQRDQARTESRHAMDPYA